MRLDIYLEKSGETQQEFASKIGVAQAAVNRWVLGIRVPRVEIMQRIVATTGGAVTPNDFYGIGDAHDAR